MCVATEEFFCYVTCSLAVA